MGKPLEVLKSRASFQKKNPKCHEEDPSHGEGKRKKVLERKFQIYVALSLVFVTMFLEEWRRFPVLFSGSHFSRCHLCISVCKRKAVSTREVVTVPDSPVVVCEDRLTAEGKSRVAHSAHIGLPLPPYFCLLSSRIALSFSSWRFESEEGKLFAHGHREVVDEPKRAPQLGTPTGALCEVLWVKLPRPAHWKCCLPVATPALLH